MHLIISDAHSGLKAGLKAVLQSYKQEVAESLRAIFNAKNSIEAKGLLKQATAKNIAERANEEIKRRTRVVRIFPNIAACQRLISAVVMEISEQ